MAAPGAARLRRTALPRAFASAAVAAILACALQGCGKNEGSDASPAKTDKPDAGPAKTAKPDFKSPVYWLAHPAHHPSRVREALPKWSVALQAGRAAEDAELSPEDFDDDQQTAPADVFYLHGTMEGWGNQASIGRYENEEWQGFNTHHQMKCVTAFTSACRAFAPLYRQSAAWGSFDLAYEDVVAAFEQYLAETPEPRPLILAGHSQGSMHLQRLVRERVAPDAAVAARVVGVFAPGAALTDDASLAPFVLEDAGAAADGGNAMALKAAQAAPSAFVWAVVAPEVNWTKTLVGWMAGGKPLGPCANPGVWAGGEHLGALLQREGGCEPVLYRGVVGGAEVRDGLLRVRPAPGAEAWLKRMGGGDYHAYDITLFWGNVRARVRDLVEAFVAARKHGAPAWA